MVCLRDKPNRQNFSKANQEKKRKKIQINEIINERGGITADTTKMQRIVRDYYEQLCPQIG